jgi:hypothetical protein
VEAWQGGYSFGKCGEFFREQGGGLVYGVTGSVFYLVAVKNEAEFRRTLKVLILAQQ